MLYPNENAGVYIASGGNYELTEVRFCERHVEPGGTMLDVGGNIGVYALLAGKLVGPTGVVHTFEPEPQNAARLRANVALNGLANVEVFETAVYSESGTVVLNVFDSRYNAWHSIGHPSLPDPDHAGRTSNPQRPWSCRLSRSTTTARRAGSQGRPAEDGRRGRRGRRAARRQAAPRAHAIGALLFEVSLPQIEALGHRPAEAFELLTARGYESFSLGPDGVAGEPVSDRVARYANYVAFQAVRKLVGRWWEWRVGRPKLLPFLPVLVRRWSVRARLR